MKVFVTGASGFIGSAVVQELIGAGHAVIGLARSEESAKKISDTGAEVLLGTLEDLEVLKLGASLADGVIHTAFIHDFTQYLKAGDVDKSAINTIGEELKGTNKPLVVTSGILALPPIDGFITEESSAENAPRTSESTALALAGKGIHASVVRLPPSVHGKGDKGFIPFIIGQARKNGISAYPEQGQNCWSAVHRLDAAKAFRLALEKAEKGAVYNVVGDNAIQTKKIAELIGDKLNLPVQSVSGEEIANHFDWMGRFIAFEGAAVSTKTQNQLGWKPEHIGLLEDMQENYF
ncbi:Nucleoside-diphosphate-sugar epimerase [Flavobacterium aquidurense]|uniref:3-beta hydroxysteroid dehydrogenase n=1 Tax=Flavobacterium frigidimaris TaxID=262320 RepID=A0ABX4BLZ9_FLAFR|nr:SDR family oxidoreductase [Flavobacterium frigidimaris]OXA76551.1 3-beta hydroxysteroid dehydrogenase [Flavobacterium frigidimaris]SDZ66958.1 Nucleoside-diphosphate-sugar epimerase [Flavobacterium aquidurense]